MPKEKKKPKIGHSIRHAPLGQVIQDDDNRGKYATYKRVIGGSAVGSKNHQHDDEHDEELLDEKTSRKILDMGRLQQMEVMQEEEAAAARKIVFSEKFDGGNSGGKTHKQAKRRDDDDSSDDESDDDEDFDEDDLLVEEDDKGYVTMSNSIGLTPDEEALLSNMMGCNDDEMPERRNLADIIMAKIEEKEAGGSNNKADNNEEMIGMELPPKVVQVI